MGPTLPLSRPSHWHYTLDHVSSNIPVLLRNNETSIMAQQSIRAMLRAFLSQNLSCLPIIKPDRSITSACKDKPYTTQRERPETPSHSSALQCRRGIASPVIGHSSSEVASESVSRLPTK